MSAAAQIVAAVWAGVAILWFLVAWAVSSEEFEVGRNREAKEAARAAFYAPVWPVVLVVIAGRSLRDLWELAR